MSQKTKSRSRKKSKIRTHKRLFPKLLKNNGIALDGDSLSVIRQDVEGNSVSFKVNKVVQPARILMYVNESFDWNTLEKVEESLPITTIKGENISSRGSELAKKLTNPGNNLTVEYRGTLFRNAEHAYQTWKSGEFDEVAYKSTAFKPRGSKKVNPDVNFNIMIEILTAKFEQHPDLVREVEEVGGVEYLEQCTHNVVGDVYWEKQGKFIEALVQAAKNVGMKNKINSINPSLISEPIIQEITEQQVVNELNNLCKQAKVKNTVTKDIQKMFKSWNVEPKVLNEVLQDLQTGGKNLSNFKFITKPQIRILQNAFKSLC